MFRLKIMREGSIEYYLNNRLHREDGPAAEIVGGGKYWFINGNRHRLDGPAIERHDGSKEWWINGVEMRKNV